MKYLLSVLLFYTAMPSYWLALPVNGCLNMDSGNRGSLSDTELFQLAVNYCSINQKCHTVIWESHKTLKETIIVKGNVRIQGAKFSGVIWGNYHASKSIIYADLNDPNKDLFVFEYPNAQASGQAIENVFIVPISDGKTAINIGNAYDVKVKDVHIHPFYPKEKRFFETGIRGDGCVNQTIENIDIEHVKSEGILMTSANTTELKNIRVLYAKYGVRVTGGSLYISGGRIFERCDSSGIQFTGTNCHLDFIYTEATPSTISTKSKIIDIRKADLLTITRCELNGGLPPVHPDLVSIALDNVGAATIQGNEIMQAGSNLSTTKNTGEVTWTGNVESPALKSHHPKVFDISRVSFVGNMSKYKRQEVQQNSINRLVSNKSEFTESTFLGTMNLSSAVVKSQNENLFRWSENLVRNWLFSTQMWAVYNNDGQPDKIQQKTSRRWFIRYNADPGTIKPGEYYTITFLAKMGAEPFNDNFNRFVIDIGDVRETLTEVTIDTSDKVNLKEYTYTIKVPEYTKPANFVDISWESTTGDQNDYIFFDKMSLENSQTKGRYIKTEGSVVIELTNTIR